MINFDHALEILDCLIERRQNTRSADAGSEIGMVADDSPWERMKCAIEIRKKPYLWIILFDPSDASNLCES